MNKLTLMGATLGLVLIAACKPISHSPESGPAGPQSGAQSAPSGPAAAPKRPARVTRERIAEIAASGRKGFWASVTEVCPKDRPLSDTTLTWNVTDTGVKRVVVYLVDPKRDADGKGRNLGGPLGPVGERTTGHWLRPGQVFKLRSRDDDREVGSITIGEKAC